MQTEAGVFSIQSMKNRFLLPCLLCALFLFSTNGRAEKTNTTKKNAVSKKLNEKTKKGKPVSVIIETNHGSIEVELNSEKAPISVKNFLNYVDRKFYDELIFHRVIDNFMIQGGGFDKNLHIKPTDAAIVNEANNGLKNDKGTLAMARTPDPNSASSQFFINLKDNDFLNYKGPMPQDYGYAVFAKVTKGMDVVEKIGKVKTTTFSQMRDVPAEPVIIKSIRRVEDKK